VLGRLSPSKCSSDCLAHVLGSTSTFRVCVHRIDQIPKRKETPNATFDRRSQLLIVAWDELSALGVAHAATFTFRHGSSPMSAAAARFDYAASSLPRSCPF
jgi:hypothetical protein